MFPCEDSEGWIHQDREGEVRVGPAGVQLNRQVAAVAAAVCHGVSSRGVQSHICTKRGRRFQNGVDETQLCELNKLFSIEQHHICNKKYFPLWRQKAVRVGRPSANIDAPLCVKSFFQQQ